MPVIVGGVHDYQTAMHLMRTGAAGRDRRLRRAPGVTTTDDVLGIGVPMATAIADAAAARRDYLDETGGRYVHVIADGGVDQRRHRQGDRLRRGRGDAGRAAGRRRPRRPGKGLYWTAAAAHPSLPRSGVVAGGRRRGRVDLQQLLFGPAVGRRAA